MYENSSMPMKRGAILGKKPLKKTEIRKNLLKKGKKAVKAEVKMD